MVLVMDSNVTPFTSENNSTDDTLALPHNIEAEQGLLGALLLNNDAFDRVSDFLLAEHFYDPVHGRLFEAIGKLIANGNLASPVTLKTYLEHDSGLNELGGATYLARLVSNATTIANAQQYARTIHDLSIRRDLIVIGEDMIHTAHHPDIDSKAHQQIEQVEQALYNLAENGNVSQGFMDFGASLAGAIDIAEKAYAREGRLSGLSTGLKALDDLTGGLQRSDLLILAGRPSMGKTALATNIAFSIAKNYMISKREGNVRRTDDGREEVLDGSVVGFFSRNVGGAIGNPDARRAISDFVVEHSSRRYSRRRV